MSSGLNQEAYEGLCGKFTKLENVTSMEFRTTSPSLALIHLQNKVDDTMFEKAVIHLLDNKVEYFCLSGADASSLHDAVDDTIIDGGYEKRGFFRDLFRPKNILTSFHVDEGMSDILNMIEFTARYKKLNRIINVIYDQPSPAIDYLKNVLKKNDRYSPRP
ncbi:MAG: hypothetical protein L3J04_00155 [Robiginitomaculum sp.]|nr:hypothetical protein [Robiginitomaculum sp.]